MKKIVSIGLLFILSSSTFAMHTINVNDGQTAYGLISQNELTRIYVQSDRIKDIKSATNDFTLEKDEDNGQIFIMPHPGKLEAFTLFVTTELGKTIALSLKPTSVPAETLALAYEQQKHDKDTEKLPSYETNIFQLVKAMSKRDGIPGYAVEKMVDSQEEVNGLEKIELMMYQGKFKGKVVSIKNQTDTLVTLNEEDLKEPNMKAIALAKKDLVPGEATEAYLVYGA